MSEETHNTSVTQPQTVQPTAPVKTAEPVKPQTIQTTKQATAPVKKPESVESQSTQPTSTVKAPDTVKPQTTQSTETVANSKQPTVQVKAPDTVEPQPTGNTGSTAPTPTKIPEPVKLPTAQPTAPVKAAEPVKPQTVQPTDTVKAPEPTTLVKTQETVASQPTQPTEVTKLSDVIPTSKVWISGLIGNRQIDCLGPIEIPLKIDKPTYPFTPVASTPNYTNQVFNYDTGEWIATDAKSQGQQLTDLTKLVTDLRQASIKYDKTAEQAQQMSVQQMQTLMTIDKKLDALTKKEGIK